MVAYNIILELMVVFKLSILMEIGICVTKIIEFAFVKRRVMSFLSHFGNLVFGCFWRGSYQSTYYIFTEQGKTGKTEICGKENHATKMTKKTKNKVTKICNEVGISRKLFYFEFWHCLGYCCIIYMQCAADAFRINSATNAAYEKSQIGSNCSEDYIGIEGIFYILM